MSPELLHNGQDGTDQAYDPRSTDVWAAGVMLVVALCGAFPFDHTQHHHRSMEEAELDLWYATMNSPATPSLGQCWPRRCSSELSHCGYEHTAPLHCGPPTYLIYVLGSICIVTIQYGTSSDRQHPIDFALLLKHSPSIGGPSLC